MGASAAVVGVGALSSYMGANAASDAADTQASAARYNADLANQTAQQQLEFNKQVYADNIARQQPYLEAGKQALSRLSTGLQQGGEFSSPFTFNQNDPSYQWRLQQGQRAMDASAASRGMLFTGGQMKALQDYGQNAASQEYSNEFNRFQADRANRFNMLSGVSGTGQTAVSGANSAGTNAASAMSSILGNQYANVAGQNMNAANASAAGTIYGNQQLTNLIGQVGGYGLSKLLTPQQAGPYSANTMDYLRNQSTSAAMGNYDLGTYY